MSTKSQIKEQRNSMVNKGRGNFITEAWISGRDVVRTTHWQACGGDSLVSASSVLPQAIVQEAVVAC